MIGLYLFHCHERERCCRTFEDESDLINGFYRFAFITHGALLHNSNWFFKLPRLDDLQQ